MLKGHTSRIKRNWRTPRATVATIVATLPLLPAAWINGVATRGQDPAWTVAAVGSILMSAIFIEAFRRVRQDGQIVAALLFLVMGIVLLGNNLQSAIFSAAHNSDHSRDLRKDAMVASDSRSSQRSQIIAQRSAAAGEVGETPADSFVTEIAQLKIKESRRWRLTNGCEPIATTAPESKLFCIELAAIGQKLARARKRDDLDAKLTAIGEKIEETGAAPSSQDPYADRVGSVLTALGVQVDDLVRQLITASRDWWRSIGLELAAAFGPSAILTLLSPRAPLEPKAKFGGRKTAGAESAAPAPAQDPRDEFVSNQLERCPGLNLTAAQMWTLWKAFCAERGISIGTRKRLSAAVQRSFQHDHNHGRPRYCDVRPVLRVVAS